ncbi:hypothetical protein WG904_16045 [Pedobacter sp. Du54]|uniref:hypothetical protein n=1 Tax=Pedobacter anseongensis TaxID=3133439 RepID=UPI0030B3A23F
MSKFTVKFFSFFLFISIIGCSIKNNMQVLDIKDNALIKSLYLNDVEIRKLDAKTDTVNLENYDKIHREQIFQLLAENKVLTSKDKIRAAWILQHTAAKLCEGELTSISPENFLLAYKLSSAALSQLEKEKDTLTIRQENIPRIVALNYDRYLLFTFGYQKFGTQFVFDDKTGEMLLAPIDTTLANDEERKKHNVEPLNVLLNKYKIKTITDH